MAAKSGAPVLVAVLFTRGPATNYERLRTFLRRQEALDTLDVGDPQIAADQFLGGLVAHQQLRMALGLPAPSQADIAQRVDEAITSFLAIHRRPGRTRRDVPDQPATE